MKYVKRFKNAFIIMSILYILLGITLIAKPEFSAMAICRFFGTIMLVPGIIRIIGFFSNDAYDNVLSLDLVSGLFYLVLGGFMLIAPKAVISALPVILGILIIIDSILRFQLAVNLKRLQHENWRIHIFLALVTAVLGSLLLFNPFAGSIILTRLIGISLSVNGAVNLWGIIFITRVFKGVI
jgi:uncharacterized membrane protein HdeD (DUF308 family)